MPLTRLSQRLDGLYGPLMCKREIFKHNIERFGVRDEFKLIDSFGTSTYLAGDEFD